jgi:nicotinate-nucleotide adenylyltransferase
MKPIGILGGTFDPVHNGHLRLAIECLEKLALAEVRLIPLYAPPHRRPPRTAAEHRLAMLKIAVKTADKLKVDDCELRRKSISYTIDTVSTLREKNKNKPLCLLMGADAFNALHTWHRWESLLDYVHLVIAERPGVAPLPEHAGLKTLLDKNIVADATVLHTTRNGKIFRLQIPWLDISATRIRDMLRMHHNPAYLMPDGVIDYIHTHQLYAGT